MANLSKAHAGKEREFIGFMDALKKKYDPEYEKHSKSSMVTYGATIFDDWVVLTLA